MGYWTHKSKFKGQEFLGTYEYSKGGVRIFKLKHRRTGRESRVYLSPQHAKRDGWVYHKRQRGAR